LDEIVGIEVPELPHAKKTNIILFLLKNV